MNNQIVTVNLIPGLSAPAVVKVSQYDVGRPITFNILDGASAASISSSMTVNVVGTKPSGLGFSQSAVIASLSTVTINTTLAMTQECGMIPAEIRFTQSGENVGTANFILAVEKTPHADGTTDGTQETMANLETRLQAEIDDLSDRIDDIEAGGSGLSQTEKNLILTLFSKAAYAEDDASTAYNALESLWASTTRTITYNLSHVSSSNTTASIEQGQSYTTTLTASTGYTLNTVSVTMGGVDITSTAYSSGTVSIPSVTGNIVITATAVLAAQSITAVYTQSGTVYDTDSIDSLKTDLVVTANYSGGTSETIPSSDYTLSGTLSAGTSTITVTYGGKTATFTVTVTEYVNYADSLANWYLSDVATATYSDGKIYMKTSQTHANNYRMLAFDRAKTLWSGVEGKTLKIRIKAYSPDWSGDLSTSSPQNQVIFGLAIYSGPTITSGNDRQKYLNLREDILPSTETEYEYTFTASLSNFTSGSGTPTSTSTFGIFVYDASPNTVYISGAEIVEVQS